MPSMASASRRSRASATFRAISTFSSDIAHAVSRGAEDCQRLGHFNSFSQVLFLGRGCACGFFSRRVNWRFLGGASPVGTLPLLGCVDDWGVIGGGSPELLGVIDQHRSVSRAVVWLGWAGLLGDGKFSRHE